MSEGAHALEERVLLLARTERDAAVSEKVLREAGLCCFVTRDLGELSAELGRGAGVILIPEEVMSASGAASLRDRLAAQPSWSDLPVMVLSRPGTAASLTAGPGEDWPNILLLELPVRVGTLVSAVQTALRARRRQYQLRRQLEQQREDQEALREADRRKDEFLAMLAHELRNPLAPVRNALHLLRLQSGDRAATDRLREMMERQVGHMSHLIDDLLDVSRISRGKISLQRERLDLSRFVQDAVEDHEDRFEAAGVALEMALPNGPAWMLGDPTRLTQIVDNLLENACKFSERGGMVTIQLRAAAGPDEWLLAVTDTGIGIEPAMLPQLFDIFIQADHSLDRGRGGLGLGLALVKGLVELHGGRVAAESAGLGQGARFTLRFPMESEPAALTAPEAPVQPCDWGLRVLIIEDNPDAAESLRMLLAAYGCEVTVAATGLEGVAAAQAAKPAVVLCDIGLPGLDGYGVARALRAGTAAGSPLLVALTGYGLEEDIWRAREAGFDAHLTKPAAPEKLLGLLELKAGAV